MLQSPDQPISDQPLHDGVLDGPIGDNVLIIQRYRSLNGTMMAPEPRIWQRKPGKLADSPSCTSDDVEDRAMHAMHLHEPKSQFDNFQHDMARTSFHFAESPVIASLPQSLAEKATFKNIVQSSAGLNSSTSLELAVLGPTVSPSGLLESNPVAAVDDWSRLFLILVDFPSP